MFFSFSVFFFSDKTVDSDIVQNQLLAGLAIVLGIPFPIWIYFKGEEMRARNPLTRASSIPKQNHPQ